MTDAGERQPPKGVKPHLYFGDAWREYPKHRWYVGTAWHYTSVEGCYGIVSNHELWATAHSMLNDAGEMSFGASRIIEFAEKWTPGRESDPRAEALLRSAIDELEQTMTENPLFVLSASKSPELLNQWANYGDSTGCAIAIDTMSLLVPEGQAAKPSPSSTLPLWLDVVYDPEEQDAHIGSVLDELVKPERLLSEAIVHQMEPESLVEQNLSMLIAALKHPGFRAEDEVRLVARPRPTTSIWYRPTPRGIVPYVRFFGTESGEDGGFQISSDPSSKLPLPIKEVRVGPPQGDSETRRVSSMREFLRAHGYNIDVGGAGIPYLP